MRIARHEVSVGVFYLHEFMKCTTAATSVSSCIMIILFTKNWPHS